MRKKHENLYNNFSQHRFCNDFNSGFIMSAYADSDTDTNHSTMHETGKSGMPNEGMMKAMQAEMQTIINTEDTAKRKALFAAHKEKMQGMMGMMQANCNNKLSMVKTTAPDHQGETD